MSDDDMAQKARERRRIDVHEKSELRYWTQKFDVIKQQPEVAVREEHERRRGSYRAWRVKGRI